MKGVTIVLSAAVVVLFLVFAASLTWMRYDDAPYNNAEPVNGRGPDSSKDGKFPNPGVTGEDGSASQSPVEGNSANDKPTNYVGQIIRIPGLGKGEEPVVLRRIDTRERVAALTFDAGWIVEPAPQLLDILAEYSVKATFFPRARWIEDNPEVALRIINEGHVMGNHSYTHRDLVRLSPEEVVYDIERSHSILTSYGLKPILYRPPYGTYNQTVLEALGQYGYKYVVMWTIDTLDWKEPGVEVIKSRIFENIRPGSIILMHVGSFQTVKALPDIILGLRDRGYKLVTVPELIGYTSAEDDGYFEYTVKAGDTLWSISERFNTPVEELIRINNL